MKREEAESSINEEDAEFDSLLQNITEEWDETSASHDDQLKQKLKKTETVGAMEKLWRLSLKLEKENTEMNSFIYDMYHEKLNSSQQEWLVPAELEKFAQAIHCVGASLTN